MVDTTIQLHSARGNKPCEFRISIYPAQDENGATRISLLRVFERDASSNTGEYPVTESVETVVSKLRIALNELAFQLAPK